MTLGGGTLFDLSDFDFGATQTLNIGSQSSGAGAGKVTFGGVSFTLGSSDLASQFDQMMASGTPFSHVDVYGFAQTGGTLSTAPVVHDMFKLAAIQTDDVDAATGAHDFTLQYGGLVESVAPQNADGSFGTPVTAGWNAVKNVSDNSFTTDINGNAIANPTPDPRGVVAVAPQDLDLYMQLRDFNGNLIGGGTAGWIKLDSASLGGVQTLNIGSQSSGTGAGKIAFDPLDVSFSAGNLSPTLLQFLASGTPFKIELAAYEPGPMGTLVDDYRFGTAALASSTADQSGVSTYTFKYGQQYVEHYTDPTSATSAPTSTQGWDIVKNVSVTASSLPATISAQQQAPVLYSPSLSIPEGGSSGAGSSTVYYIQFTDYNNQAVNLGGSSLFDLSDFDFGATQTLNIGSQSSGAGAGKVTFGGVSFTLGSSDLASQFDQMMASGTPFSHVDVYGFAQTGGTLSTAPVVHDMFKLAAIQTDDVDAATGAHDFTLQYGGLVESVAPQNADGSFGTPVTAGWNAVKNVSDNSFTTDINGNAIANPTPDPRGAVAVAPQDLDLYMQLRDFNGNLIGGGTAGWIKLDSASLGGVQTLNIGSQSSGTGAGKIAFDPLDVSFSAGNLSPTLLQFLASGTPFKIELAAYEPGPMGTLVDDYRFGTAALASSTADQSGVSTYTFKYGQQYVEHYTDPTSATSAPTSTQGWDIVKNVSVTASSLPATISAQQQAPVLYSPSLSIPEGGSSGAGSSTVYYIQFTDYNNQAVNLGGSSLFDLSDFDFGATQTLNIGSQSSGAGAGKVTFGGVSFTLGSSDLASQFDQMMASGTPFSHVDVYGFAQTGGTLSTAPVVHDMFKLAAIQTDDVDAATGAHDFTLQYGGLVESVAPQNADGSFGTPVTAGWNAVKNVSDNSFTTDINGNAIANPTPDPRGAVAVAPQDLDLYMQLRDFNGNLIGGGTAGWIKLDSASLGGVQTLNIGSQSSGTGAGKIAFDPLDVSFSAGNLSPTLLQFLASGTPFKIELAAYEPGPMGTLVDDYRFGTAALASSTADQSGVSTYTFKYGQQYVEHYTDPTSATSAPTSTQGWDIVKNVSVTASSLPATISAQQQAPVFYDTSLSIPEGTACYCAGTQIETVRGERAVEDLVIGDILVTASGAERPIKWIGRRSYAGRFANANDDILPVCFRPGSLGESVPRRDLWVSPKHAMFLDGVLIPAEHLVNGVSVTRAAQVERVDYVHIELDSHDVIVAEGALSETYVDDDSRAMFHNALEFTALYPEAEEAAACFCAPRVESGFVLDTVRRTLAARARLHEPQTPTCGSLRGFIDRNERGAIAG